MRRAALLTALALLVPASAAHASPQQESLFMDDNLLLYRGDAVADRTLDELRRLGVDRVRVSLHWRAIAPNHRSLDKPAGLTDPTRPAQYPAAAFNNHDHLLRAASARGISVLVNVTGGAPLWATGRVDGAPVGLQYRPDPRAFRQFVQMLGTRYDGRHRDDDQGHLRLPRITAWSIWNEPNQAALLQPQWEEREGEMAPAAPRIYRSLVRGALAGLRRSGHAGETILLGETAPRGVDRHDRTGSMRPVPFLASLLCLDQRTLRPLRAKAAQEEACDAGRWPLRVTGYAHHPYSVVAAPDAPDPNPDDVTLADRDRLVEVLDAAQRAGRLPPGLPVWWTEFGWQTLPPDPIRGVPLTRQARWIAEAERMTWDDPRVVAHAQFLLRDDLPRDEPAAPLRRRWGTYQSGLRFADGRPKPAWAAYRLPLAAPREAQRGRPMELWGMVRPGLPGAFEHVQLQFAPFGQEFYSDVGEEISVLHPQGYFQTTVAPQESGTWRFLWIPSTGGREIASGVVGVRVA